ncbi:MAG: protein-glutamine glutaminase family protein [Bacteriovoracaceae bacterium]|jgi:phosphoenolpyruvate synthase/pyruvate phosphate dikinase|nr:protein-glutamine glutaminase family protein [Bacteriovoracaceae bacterium]
MKIILVFSLLTSLSFAQVYKSPSDNFTMTNLTKKEAKQIYSKLNNNTKTKAQCYNKAYIWAYNMYETHRIYSNKIFIFYTSKYLKQRGGDWSYHVAPLVLVDNKKAVFDKTFWHSNTKQLSIQGWVDILMRKDNLALEYTRKKLRTKYKSLKVKMRSRRFDRIEKAKFQVQIEQIETELAHKKININKKVQIKCPIVSNISEIENKKAQDSEYCYLLESSMYYKDPVDLRLFESQSLYMTDFNEYDLKKARRQAFRR